MGDLLILGALAIWFGLWAVRDLGMCEVRRGQALPRARRAPASRQSPAASTEDADRARFEQRAASG
jgi:hypothetical protein